VSDAPSEIEFLTVDVVLALHQRQLDIVSNHPFVDGNKRTGLLAAQVFLDVNGVSLEHDSEAFYALTMGVAEGRVGKSAVTAELERIAKSKST
jgi:death on curing protein